ncbi:MAG: glycine/sarcosine/betaine reductase selenoprotein B family protein [Pseudomonadota bacterium]
MVRLADLHADMRDFLIDHPVPDIEMEPWTEPAPAGDRRVALVSSAGLKLKSDQPFAADAADYRVIPADKVDDVVMDHVSTSHDRTGFHQDVNIAFPLHRLNELADDGAIGSVADFHYSFMGATDPKLMESAVRDLAGILKADGVNTVVLAPV